MEQQQLINPPEPTRSIRSVLGVAGFKIGDEVQVDWPKNQHHGETGQILCFAGTYHDARANTLLRSGVSPLIPIERLRKRTDG